MLYIMYNMYLNHCFNLIFCRSCRHHLLHERLARTSELEIPLFRVTLNKCYYIYFASDFCPTSFIYSKIAYSELIDLKPKNLIQQQKYYILSDSGFSLHVSIIFYCIKVLLVRIEMSFIFIRVTIFI